MLDSFGSNVYSPVETLVKSGASFCIAGEGLSAVFIGKEIPDNIPNRLIKWNNESTTTTVTKSSRQDSHSKSKHKPKATSKSEPESADREIEELKILAEENDKKISRLKKSVEGLLGTKEKQEEEFSTDKQKEELLEVNEEQKEKIRKLKQIIEKQKEDFLEAKEINEEQEGKIHKLKRIIEKQKEELLEAKEVNEEQEGKIRKLKQIIEKQKEEFLEAKEEQEGKILKLKRIIDKQKEDLLKTGSDTEVVSRQKKEIESLRERLQRYEEQEVTDEGNDNFFIGEDDEEHQKVIKMIGEGATSIAYKVIDERTSEVMCKKVVKCTDDEGSFKKLQNSMKEISVLKEIDHPSICKAIGFNMQEKISNLKIQKDEEKEEEIENEDEEEEEEEKTTVALFLEFIPYKLKDILKTSLMNNTLKTKIAVEIAFGMEHIHQLGMIHRDLKIENIMLNYIFEAKIIDFDLVHVTDIEGVKNTLTKGIGTLDYMSPEMLNNEEYTNKTDVYSYGIVLFAIFTGNVPKQNLTDKMTKKRIPLPRPSSSISSLCISIIEKCTRFEPEERPSFTEIIECMHIGSFALAKEVDSRTINNRYSELKRIQERFNLTHQTQTQS